MKFTDNNKNCDCIILSLIIMENSLLVYHHFITQQLDIISKFKEKNRHMEIERGIAPPTHNLSAKIGVCLMGRGF